MQSPRLFRTAIFFCIITILLTVCTAPAGTQQNSYRNIVITALVDQELLENDAEGTEREVKDIITFVTNVFQKEFGVTFELRTVKPWQFPHGAKTLNASDALRNIKLHARDDTNSDIVLGFTDKKLTRCNRQTKKTSGCSLIYGNVAVMQFDKTTAQHEIAHLFGAHHSDDPSSVMYEEKLTASTHFDPKNKSIVQQTIKEKFSIQNTPRCDIRVFLSHK